MTTALAVLALLVALAALALAVVVMRQNGATTAEIRAHRRAHARAAGSADPDRRRADVGPPAGEPDRRTPNRATQPVLLTVDQPLTRERADEVRRNAQALATAELEQQDAPTTAIRAQRPTPGPTP